MRPTAVLLLLLTAACAERSERGAGDAYAALRLTPGWSGRTDALGRPEAYWADPQGRFTYAFLCSPAVPELVVQALGDGSAAGSEPMSLWVAGHRWTLTSHPGGEGAYVEGRLPLAEGVRVEMLGAGQVRVEAPNRRDRPQLSVGAPLRAVIAGCRRVDVAPRIEVAPAAKAP